MTEGVFDLFTKRDITNDQHGMIINPDGTITLSTPLEILPDNAS